MKIKHGMCATRFYGIWETMKSRCLIPTASGYANYGAKGINIADNWKSFLGFKKDMYKSYLKHCEKFTEKNTSIDRINNELGYFKENCRWATFKEQCRNRNTFHPTPKNKKNIQCICGKIFYPKTHTAKYCSFSCYLSIK
jgi:hypothetical protein